MLSTPMKTLALVSSLASFISQVLAATCEVAGGTSDDTAAIKAALSSCNNGGTVSLSFDLAPDCLTHGEVRCSLIRLIRLERFCKRRLSPMLLLSLLEL